MLKCLKCAISGHFANGSRRELRDTSPGRAARDGQSLRTTRRAQCAVPLTLGVSPFPGTRKIRPTRAAATRCETCQRAGCRDARELRPSDGPARAKPAGSPLGETNGDRAMNARHMSSRAFRNRDRAMNARHMSSRAFTTLASTRGSGLPRTFSSPSFVVMSSDGAGLSASGVILMPFGRSWVRLGLACECAASSFSLRGGCCG